jgi:hypothetical protein
LDEVLNESSKIEWEQVLKKIRNAICDPQDKYDEPSFGVDGGEFWATLGGVTGRLDHEKAIRIFRIAAQHAEVSGSKFRAYLGLALQYKQIGDVSNYKRYLRELRTVGRAHQKFILDQLEGA